jgi:hypothetical protein
MVNTQIRSLTSAEYYQMMESGIIREGERVELILGQIFTMAAKVTRHTVATSRLLKSLLMLIGDQAIVRCQDPISLPNFFREGSPVRSERLTGGESRSSLQLVGVDCCST